VKRARKWFLVSSAAVVVAFVAIVNPLSRARLDEEVEV
jgi:hypothetical protein